MISRRILSQYFDPKVLQLWWKITIINLAIISTKMEKIHQERSNKEKKNHLGLVLNQSLTHSHLPSWTFGGQNQFSLCPRLCHTQGQVYGNLFWSTFVWFRGCSCWPERRAQGNMYFSTGLDLHWTSWETAACLFTSETTRFRGWWWPQKTGLLLGNIGIGVYIYVLQRFCQNV